VHVCVGKRDGGVEDGVSCFERVAYFVENYEVGAAAAEEEVEVHADGDFTREDVV